MEIDWDATLARMDGKRRINLRRAGERAAARRAELAARRAEALGTDGARRFAANLRGLVVVVEEEQ